MASSLLFRKVDKMKQRLSEGLSCSSAASTSVATAAFISSGRAIDRHSPHPAAHMSRRRLSSSSSAQAPPPMPKPPGSSSSSSSSKLKKKKTQQQQAPSPASSSRFLLNSSRLQLHSDADDGIVTVLDSLPPLPSFIDDHVFVTGAGGDREAPAVQSTAAAETSSSSASWSSSASSSSSRVATAKKKDDDDRSKSKMAMTRSCSTTRQHQVVVLRVSLHCKGCAGKVKKHISKMEGVTSFEIDIATKKVTVAGDVTPLGVLNSISKVKAAQFWPTASSSSTSQYYYSSPPRASASF